MKKVLTITKKIIHWKLMILVLLALPLVVFTLLTSKFNIYGLQSFVVLTGSMSPSIPQGSVVYTKGKSVYSAGDIISFKRDNVTVTHRVAEVTDAGYVTRGDANNSNDKGVVAASDVIGASFFSVPHLGNFVLFLRTFEGFLLFVILPGVLFIGFELWNIKNHIVEHTRKKVLEEVRVS